MTIPMLLVAATACGAVLALWTVVTLFVAYINELPTAEELLRRGSLGATTRRRPRR